MRNLVKILGSTIKHFERLLIKIIKSLCFTFIVYKAYSSANDHKFVIAFLGGAITLAILIFEKEGE